MTEEELKELEELGDSLINGFAAFSIGNLVLNVFLSIGIKHLWKMVTLLQFVVFMRAWQVLLPAQADTFLKSLKSLALLEFLPTENLDKWLMDLFGIKYETEDGFENTDATEEHPSLFNQLSVFIIAGFVILIFVLILICLRVCIKLSSKVNKVYQSLKNKLFYQTFINFLMLGTLKIQISIGNDLFMGSFIPITSDADKLPTENKVICTSIALALMTLIPILFGVILWRNRKDLDKEQVKSKIGAMYQFLNPKKLKVISYPVVFLARRTLFIAITFLSYQHPSMQVELMQYSTLVYICYLGHGDCIHETPRQRQIEMMNECLLVGICYHFVLFANPVWQDELRD